MWTKGLKTARFAKLCGKKKEDMFYTDIIWEQNNTGAWALTGMRFFAYHLMGVGKVLSKSDMLAVHPGPLPPVADYQPEITNGTTIHSTSPVTRVKIEPSRDHKRRQKQQRVEKKAVKLAAKEKASAIRESATAEMRYSKRCSFCQRPFLRSFFRNTHEQSCRSKQQLTVRERQMADVQKFDFEILKGHAHRVASNSSTLVPMSEVCAACPATAIPPGAAMVPYSVACLVRSLDDAVVYNAEQDRDLPLPGWATREANVRPTQRFSSDVVAELRWCFDQKTRMGAHKIQQHLIKKYGIYGGPTKCLRQAQIIGWISSEVARRKKACVMAAVNDVSKGTVEVLAGAGAEGEASPTDVAATPAPPAPVGPVPAPAAPALVLAPAASVPTSAASVPTPSAPTPAPVAPPSDAKLKRPIESAPSESHASKAPKKAPNPTTVAAAKRHAPAKIDAPPAKKATCAPKAATSPAKRVVSLVLSKCGRRSEYEYECRFVGRPADETSWESADDLTSLEDRRAVQQFEEDMRRRSSMALMSAGIAHPIRTECCNSVVESDSYDEAKGKCLDIVACNARKQELCQQPTASRQRRAPVR